MKNFFNLAFVLISAIFSLMLTIGCSNSEPPKATEYELIEVEDPNQEELEESLKNLPEEKREELKLRRNINLILIKYVKLEGRRYRLDISEEEAGKLGISPEWLEIAKNEIEDANKNIAKMDADGQVLELPDPQELFKNK
ncbi:hypothetical protein [uncultured Duncaniella sp.]|uniref:hypothetical protein n=1 Tax=uncultured Duncaniella sp. TaxID=2768039 RepID=UPI00266F2B89|nr:hypothetical protein [uncultured Duncaniella sp.]